MRFLAALSFLTIIPVPHRRLASPEEIRGSLRHFPVVGLIIGLILAGLSWLLGLLLPPAVVNALLIVAMVVITGALHLDGFIDTCDGLGGHRSVDERWRIMHDSRAGAFGITGVVLLLLVKYALLNSVPVTLLMATLVIVPVVGRWAMVYAVFDYPYARPSGLGKVFKDGPNRLSFALATITALAVATGVAWWADVAYFYLAGAAVVLGTWVTVLLVAAYLKGKFAGLTGDTYGSINEVAEVCVLILIVMAAHNQWL